VAEIAALDHTPHRLVNVREFVEGAVQSRQVVDLIRGRGLPGLSHRQGSCDPLSTRVSGCRRQALEFAEVSLAKRLGDDFLVCGERGIVDLAEIAGELALL